MADPISIEIIADPVDKIACRKCGKHMEVSGFPHFTQVECPECHTLQPVPAKLSQFLLLEILGTGGMGAVYQALDTTLGRYVAIKVMHRSLGDDPQFVENFLREARAAAALNHRNIVQIYSCGQAKGQPYIVMELVSGGRMDKMIASGQPMDEVRALEIGIDVAEGLKAAHDIGLIHGDIKPANILFDKDGTSKVADFGLARFIKQQKKGPPGEIWGTPYYIAPEKARGEKVDHRADIYSLGATLYHALGARPPFEGTTATDVVLARLKNPAIGLRVIRPELQPETADVISRMLEADPVMRYPTFISLLADLREALRIARQEKGGLHAPVKKKSMLPWVIGGAVLIAVVGLIFGITAKKAADRKKQAQVPILSMPIRIVPISVATSMTAGVASAIPLQPFSLVQQDAIARSIQLFLTGKPVEMRTELENLARDLPAGDSGRPWIRLYQAVPYMIADDQTKAFQYYTAIQAMKFESPSANQPHPGFMPQAIAGYLSGAVPESALMAEKARWPIWFGHAIEFFIGVQKLRDAQEGAAMEHLAAYNTVVTNGLPSWPYALRPISRLMVERLSAWEEQKKRCNRLISNRQAADAQGEFEAFRNASGPLMYPSIDRELNQIRRIAQSQARKQQEKERKVLEGQVKEELDRVKGVISGNAQFVARKEFRKGEDAVPALESEMKTPEGKAAAQLLRERYERMEGLRRIIIDGVRGSPYLQSSSPELRGDVVFATVTGITIKLGEVGTLDVTWDQVSMRLFVQMARDYILNSQLSNKDKADKLLSLILLANDLGSTKTAAALAVQATQMDPDISVAIKRFIPDLVWP